MKFYQLLEEAIEDYFEEIRKIDGKYIIYSKKGKKLSKPYTSEEEAKKRLKQIEFFKHLAKNK